MIENFIHFERDTKRQLRGGVVMYDVKGHYKWLTLSELFNYWHDQNGRLNKGAADIS